MAKYEEFYMRTSSEGIAAFVKGYKQGCADPGKSYGSGSGSFSRNFYGSGSGSETDPTNFKKLSWELIKSKYFQEKILQ